MTHLPWDPMGKKTGATLFVSTVCSLQLIVLPATLHLLKSNHSVKLITAINAKLFINHSKQISIAYGPANQTKDLSYNGRSMSVVIQNQ